jgi:hypothetical protein
MKLTNNFVQSKMNKDTDERLLPKGQYPHAENISVANSDASDVGAIENNKGNELLTNLGLTNATTLGSFTDGSNQKLYWFVHSQEKDLVLEYDVVNKETNVLLESSGNGGVLNFDPDFLITGVSKVINGDSDRDLLIWTDDLNPIRKINIERSKGYTADSFTDEEVSLIKSPPKFAPRTVLTYTSSQVENAIEDSFYSFCYRYKYLDGEYSALSSYSNYKFSPNEFKLNYQTMENEGMVNAFNAVRIFFNTGDKTVTDIQLVLKESNSNQLSIIETLNKKDELWENSVEKDFLFANSKKYLVLPEMELFRPYDNVPLKAKAMDMINNRLILGNYVEGYDLVNSYGDDVVIDYELSLLSKSLLGTSVPVTLFNTSTAGDTISIDLQGKSLAANSRITFDLDIEQVSYEGTYQNAFSYITNESFSDVAALAASSDFQFFVEDVMTNHFISNYSNTPPANSSVLTTTGFSILSSTATTMKIKAPTITYLLNGSTNGTVSRWTYRDSTAVTHRDIAVNTSLKSNRSYEVGLIYLDKYNRATTVITDKHNTISVPQKNSANQNVIVMNINHQPPAFADRYKVVVKQNKAQYETIYTNVFYEDGLYRWVKLEGANKDKVSEGQTLIVKSDLGGLIEEVIKVRVLEVSNKAADFIEGNKNPEGSLIPEDAGLYMKIKPSGFDMNFSSATSRTFEGSSHLRYPTNTFTNPSFGEGSVANSNFVPYPLGAGSSIRIYIKFSANGSIAYSAEYDKSFKSSSDYASIQAWFQAEVGDLGSFGNDFTRGYGFSAQGEQFFVRAHRDGTATRNISTTVLFEVLSSDGLVIFETESVDTDTNIYYETEQTFQITGGYHQGNLQNQSLGVNTAVVEIDFFNCYAQGNGAESYKYKDAFNKNFLNIDLRPSSTSVEEYKSVRRYSDLTYSATYNENTNLNNLNEFNLSTANYKEDIDKKYGYIQKIYAKDTDLILFQEDKVSRVLYGKSLLMSADGNSNVSSIQDILGQQVAFAGEYGISRNPESFAIDANNIYFTDAKRGCVCRLGLNGIIEISMAGMVTFFRDAYKDSLNTKKFGGYDPYSDQYVLHNSDNLATSVFNIDCSGTFSRNDFLGSVVVNIDYGFNIGTAGFSYSSNGLPVKYDITYNGVTYSTGFVGDLSYNPALSNLGLPAITGSGTGVFEFNKNDSVPNNATVTITTPIVGTNFSLSGNCVVADNINVTSLVINGKADEGLTIKSRYKWTNNSYSSSFKTYNNLFEAGNVDIFDPQFGREGSTVIPLTGSTVRVESYKGFSDTATFNSEDRLGYLITNTLYNEADVENLVSLMTFVAPTVTISATGDITNSIDFVFNRALGESYLYLLWDYRGLTVLVDDTATVANAGIVNVNVLSNDTIVGNVDGVIVLTAPTNGTAIVQVDNTITYTHNGSNTTTDSFVYAVDSGSGFNDTANVVVTVAAVPTTSYSYEGIYELNDPAHPNGGSLTYVDSNGVTQNITTMWSGTCVTFESQSAPTNLVDVATCVPLVCLSYEWNLQGLTEDTFVTMDYKDCNYVDQNISDFVGNLGFSVFLTGLQGTFVYSHGSLIEQ